MDLIELKEKIFNYNFIENSISSFSKEYKICTKTISKYLNKWNIPYQKREINIKQNRDRFGKFKLENLQIAEVLQKPKIKSKNKNPLIKSQEHVISLEERKKLNKELIFKAFKNI